MPTSSPVQRPNPTRARHRPPAVVSTLAVVLALTSVAHAYYAGESGLIAFDATVDGNTDIYVIHPDGTGLVRLTSDAAPD